MQRKEHDVRDDTGNGRSDSEAPQRGGNDTAKLTYIVGRHAELAKQIQEAKWEQKELEDSAWEQCGYTAKAVKRLSKESAWDEVKREARRQLEEEIDRGRAALGLLAGTPLGEAELERMEREGFASEKPRRKRKAKGQQPEASV